MANKLPWSERVNMLSINPEAASIGDIARMAAELSEYSLYIDNLERFIDLLWLKVKEDYEMEAETYKEYLKAKARRQEYPEVNK